GDRFRGRSNAAAIAREHGGDRLRARSDPEPEPIVAMERAVGDEVRVVRIRIRVDDGGDRIARRRHRSGLMGSSTTYLYLRIRKSRASTYLIAEICQRRIYCAP